MRWKSCKRLQKRGAEQDLVHFGQDEGHCKGIIYNFTSLVPAALSAQYHC